MWPLTLAHFCNRELTRLVMASALLTLQILDALMHPKFDTFEGCLALASELTNGLINEMEILVDIEIKL